MTRPTEPLPPYHLIDDYHTRAGLTPELILAIGLSARRHGLARVDAVAAVVPGSECDQYEYRLDLPTGAVSATWLIDHGCVGDFAEDPALRFYLQRGIPVIAAFEHRDDYFALWTTLPPDAGAVW